MTTDIHSAFFPGNPDLAPVLMLHGTGGDESDLLPIATFLFPEHPKLGIRGRVSENGSNRYFIRHEDGSFDLENLKQETDWLLNTIEKETQCYQLDAKQLIVLGFSNGANIAAYAWLNQPTTFKTAVLLHPMMITPPQQTRNLSGYRAFATYGDVDPIVSEDNFDQLMSQLQNAQASVEVFKNHQSHHLTQTELMAAQSWIKNL
ncbi:alpha/beta hydrolase [Lactobacillus sp. LC28-10]|uniref:Alpha/beta hydrolase n=1 Tax=Secundilactobacillus angelensis TaxID=2722706 RepID=A0ABX1KVV5_9LACO|nr:alpha/beta hydrolase [Secundilactobacillus angelensis]MCH5462462.1 alpha/beta hydrolase [Secundilactobacillus angelensis]NLR18056.1 alpha/beta hydrolase [Secundilactobacillus angelensis]